MGASHPALAGPGERAAAGILFCFCFWFFSTDACSGAFQMTCVGSELRWQGIQRLVGLGGLQGGRGLHMQGWLAQV